MPAINQVPAVYVAIKPQYVTSVISDIKTIGKFLMSKYEGSKRRDIWSVNGTYYQIFSNPIDFNYKDNINIYVRSVKN